MKRFIAALMFVSSIASATETYTPDEIRGTLGLINNTASNSRGAILILDDRTKYMSIVLREHKQVAPLITKKDGKETINHNAFIPKKITSKTWSFKTFGNDSQTFIDLIGDIQIRKEGMNSSYEIVMYRGFEPLSKAAFNEIWNLYVKSSRMVVEIEIDGSPMQLNFVR
jgi:hypothetical protein